MSLIQEALRRQHQEDAKSKSGTGPTTAPGVKQAEPPVPPPKPGTGAVPPPLPPPLPEPEESSPEDESALEAETVEKAPSRQRFVLAGIVAGAALLIVLAMLMLWFGVVKFRNRPEPQAASAVPQSPTNQVSSTATGQSDTATAASVQPEPASTAKVAAAVAATDQTEVASVRTAAAATTADVPAAAVAMPPPVVRWPSLTLKAVLNRGQGRGVAFINGTAYEVGDEVDGATIASCGDQCVQLTYKGERRTLRVGGTIQ